MKKYFSVPLRFLSGLFSSFYPLHSLLYVVKKQKKYFQRRTLSVYTQTAGRRGCHRALSRQTLARGPFLLSFQAPVEIPGVPLSSFFARHHRRAPRPRDARQGVPPPHEGALRRARHGPRLPQPRARRGLLRRREEEDRDAAAAAAPAQARHPRRDRPGLDVDALSVVSRGMELYRKSCDGTLIVITHNTRILERLEVDRVHVMVLGTWSPRTTLRSSPTSTSTAFERFERAGAPTRPCRAGCPRPGADRGKSSAPRSRTSTAAFTTSDSEEGYERLRRWPHARSSARSVRRKNEPLMDARDASRRSSSTTPCPTPPGVPALRGWTWTTSSRT